MNSPRQPYDWQAHYLIPIMILPNQSIHCGVLKAKRKGNLLHENDQAGHWKTHFKDRRGWVSEFDLQLSGAPDRVQCQEKPCSRLSSSIQMWHSSAWPRLPENNTDSRIIKFKAALKKKRINTWNLPAVKQLHFVWKWSRREEVQEGNDRGQHLHQIHALHCEGNHTFQVSSLASRWG